MDNRFNITDALRGGNSLDKELLDEITRQFRTEGFVILDGSFSEELVKNMREELFESYSEYFDGSLYDDALKVGDKRFQVSMNIKGAFNAPGFYANPAVLATLAGLLEDDFLINNLNCVVAQPGARAMKIHRDAAILKKSPLAHLAPPFGIAMLIPLVDIDESNGITRLWPRSHRHSKGKLEMDEDNDFVDPHLSIGSCVLMDFRLCHQGLANSAEAVRPLLYCAYSNPWFFDYRNFQIQSPLIMDDENFEKVPLEHKELFMRRNLDLSHNYKQLNKD